jgi:hypothetical protein
LACQPSISVSGACSLRTLRQVLATDAIIDFARRVGPMEIGAMFLGIGCLGGLPTPCHRFGRPEGGRETAGWRGESPLENDFRLHGCSLWTGHNPGGLLIVNRGMRKDVLGYSRQLGHFSGSVSLGLQALAG